MNEVDAQSVYGGTIFPNIMIDTSGTAIIVTQLFPLGPAVPVRSPGTCSTPTRSARPTSTPAGWWSSVSSSGSGQRHL